MLKTILRNWKTSLAGIAAGVLQMAAAWPDEARRVWGMVGGLVIAFLGILAKDATTKNGDGK